MWLGIGLFGLSILMFLIAERCRRTPCECQDVFMAKNGFTKAITAIPYVGRAEDARHAIQTDVRLRKRFLLELYLRVLLLIVFGVLLILYGK